MAGIIIAIVSGGLTLLLAGVGATFAIMRHIDGIKSQLATEIRRLHQRIDNQESAHIDRMDEIKDGVSANRERIMRTESLCAERHRGATA